MPKKSVDYTNTIIYKIVCKDLTIKDLYIGHTTQFTKRKSGHKADLKIKKHKLQITILENGGWDNWDMIEVEKYSCVDSNEARARERYWYELLNASLNGQSPNLNIENCKINKDKYYKLNRDVILQKVKNHYVLHKEDKNEYLKNYREQNKELSKKYREDNKEAIAIRKKEWREDNKDTLRKKNDCECGGKYTNANKLSHLKTKKHLNFIQI